MKRVCCCYLFIIFFYQAFSQTAVEKVKFSKPDPATPSNSRVTSVLQDSDGFLWVGTEDGLNRFDGYEFKVYRNDPADSNSLTKNSILQIYQDNRGVLWISTANGGLHRYNSNLDNFTRLREYSFDCEIRTFYEDRDYIWVGGVRSYHAFVDKISKTSGETLERHTLFPSKYPVQFLARASDKSFWVGVRKIGFFKWDIATNRSIKYSADPRNPKSIVSNHVHKAVEDAHGNIWIGTEGGLSKFNKDKETFTNYILSVPVKENMPLVNDILNLCIDRDYLWLGTQNGGLFRFNMTNGAHENFVFNKYDPSSLPDNSIWAIYKDHEGRIWIGTYSKGICVIDRLKEKFSEVDIPLENDIVNTIWQDSKKRFLDWHRRWHCHEAW
jgi:ligand-binding sensor domain-containing protein